MINAKVDKNQPEIVQAFRNAGCTVTVTSAVGKGYPDINVGAEGIMILGEIDGDTLNYLDRMGYKVISGVNLLVEIKDGEKTESQRKLTPQQIEWHSNWKGHVVVIKNVEEVKNLLE